MEKKCISYGTLRGRALDFFIFSKLRPKFQNRGGAGESMKEGLGEAYQRLAYDLKNGKSQVG